MTDTITRTPFEDDTTVPTQLLIREARVRRRRRLSLTASVLVALLVGAVVVAGDVPWDTSPRPGPSTASRDRGAPLFRAPTHEPAGWSVTYPITLPADYGALGGLAADPTSGTTWIVANAMRCCRTSTALFSFRAQTDRLSLATVLSSQSPEGYASPMTVAPDGDVWIGLGDHLVRFDPTTHQVAHVTLPAVRAGVAAATAADPVNPDDPIDALSADGDGEIVVGRDYATTLQVVDTATLAVTAITLPTDTVVGRDTGNFSDVTVDHAGQDVAVVLVAQPHGHTSTIHELGQFVDGRWDISDAHCQAWDATFTGERLAVTDIAGCVAEGSRVPGPAPVVLHFPAGVRTHLEPTAVELADGTLVTATPSGVRAVRGTEETAPFDFGEAKDVISPPDLICRFGHGCEPPPPPVLPVGPERYVWAGGDAVWFVPDLVPGKVGLLARTSTS